MGVRSFIAVECDNINILTKINEVQKRLEATGAKLKLVETQNIHMTIKFLGDLEDHQVPLVSEIVRGIEFQPFSFMVDGVGVFPNLRRPTTIWVGVSEGGEELGDIFNRVQSELAGLGFKRERRKFHPHLTVARVRGGRKKVRLVEELDFLKNYEFGLVKVDRITLKKSVLTRKGPIYSTLAESKSPVDI